MSETKDAYSSPIFIPHHPHLLRYLQSPPSLDLLRSGPRFPGEQLSNAPILLRSAFLWRKKIRRRRSNPITCCLRRCHRNPSIAIIHSQGPPRLKLHNIGLSCFADQRLCYSLLHKSIGHAVFSFSRIAVKMCSPSSSIGPQINGGRI